MNLCHPQDIALANKLQMNLMTVALFHSSSLHSPRPPFFLGKVNIIPGNLCSCTVLVFQRKSIEFMSHQLSNLFWKDTSCLTSKTEHHKVQVL